MPTKTSSALVESLIWIGFAAFAYYFSFNFEKEIEIYRYGASGWPRAIILLIFIAAVLMFIKRGKTTTGLAVEATSKDKTENEQRSIAYYLRVSATLLLPILYAGLMQHVGFYTLTPFFIFALLLLAGERRLKVLVTMSIGIYAIFVFIFGKLLYINLPVGTMHPFYDFSNWLLVIIR